MQGNDSKTKDPAEVFHPVPNRAFRRAHTRRSRFKMPKFDKPWSVNE